MKRKAETKPKTTKPKEKKLKTTKPKPKAKAKKVKTKKTKSLAEAKESTVPIMEFANVSDAMNHILRWGTSSS